MLSSTLERVESLLMTIDKLRVVKIKHLQEIHQLKSYRNACRVVKQLSPYIHETYFQREKLIYLNKKGRDLIASETDEVKINMQTVHSLLRNEVFIYLNCPYDWKIEYPLETSVKAPNNFDIRSIGLSLNEKKKVVCDAVFKRNGYFHLIEVDNTQDMRINKKKIESYREMLPELKSDTPILYFFTKTENRKRKLEEWLKGVNHKVLTFEEIR